MASAQIDSELHQQAVATLERTLAIRRATNGDESIDAFIALNALGDELEIDPAVMEPEPTCVRLDACGVLGEPIHRSRSAA